MQGANSKNITIRIIAIRIVFHYGELVTISQSEPIEASGESIAWFILFMCLVKWVTSVLISGIYVQHWILIIEQVPPCVAVRISKANLFCKTTILSYICSSLRAEIAFLESCKVCWVKLVRASVHSTTSVVPREEWILQPDSHTSEIQTLPSKF